MSARIGRAALAGTVALLVLTGCAAQPSPVGTWREVDGKAATIVISSDGTATLTGLSELDAPDSCALVSEGAEIDGTWEAAEGSSYDLATDLGSASFHFDYWYGQPREDKALIVPCGGDVVWVFAKVEG